jgi:hypothetical protein
MRPGPVGQGDASQRIDINNISMVVKNTGSFAYDTEAGAAGLEFPKGTGKTAVFAAGLWMGALVGPDVRVSVAEYSDDYRPGQAVGGVPDNSALAEYKVYKLNRVYKDAAGNIDAATRDAVLADYTAGAVVHGAPPVTVLPDGSLSITGDQMLWSVYNDLGKGADHNGASSTVPLGIEVQQTTFAFSRQGALGNTVFTKYKIINRRDTRPTGVRGRPDLGGFTDDLVGATRRRRSASSKRDQQRRAVRQQPPSVSTSCRARRWAFSASLLCSTPSQRRRTLRTFDRDLLKGPTERRPI